MIRIVVDVLMFENVTKRLPGWHFRNVYKADGDPDKAVEFLLLFYRPANFD